ncbi:hypothetical protein BDR05DRAFT_965329 [Suillus weaverae]|nr:hypothetical protein BDR05DRAFT_965329 [Suillus weaverae]
MAVALSAPPKRLERRYHSHPESGAWPWHCQRRLRNSKNEITHKILRAGHGRGTSASVKKLGRRDHALP